MKHTSINQINALTWWIQCGITKHNTGDSNLKNICSGNSVCGGCWRSKFWGRERGGGELSFGGFSLWVIFVSWIRRTTLESGQSQVCLSRRLILCFQVDLYMISVCLCRLYMLTASLRINMSLHINVGFSLGKGHGQCFRQHVIDDQGVLVDRQSILLVVVHFYCTLLHAHCTIIQHS